MKFRGPVEEPLSSAGAHTASVYTACADNQGVKLNTSIKVGNLNLKLRIPSKVPHRQAKKTLGGNSQEARFGVNDLAVEGDADSC
jgi:hypothetical protein